MRGLQIAVAGLSLLTATLAHADMTAKEAKVTLTDKFKNMKPTSVEETPVKGLFEVVSGDQIFYWTEAGYMIFGEMWSADGKSLTAEKRKKLVSAREQEMAAVVDKLSLDNAVRIGTGAHKVIEFTDPDCPYCRKVDAALAGRTDLSRYVFLMPLKQLHPHADRKAALILSSKDQASTLKEVFSGKMDKKDLPQPSPEQAKTLGEIAKTAETLGINGTPSLWIDGHHVNGADIPQIEELLKPK